MVPLRGVSVTSGHYGEGIVGSTNPCDLNVFMDVSVIVVGGNGLEWVLAWRQIGVRNIRLVLGTDIVRKQWKELLERFGSYLKDVEVIEGIAVDEPRESLVCITMGSNDEFGLVKSILGEFSGRVLGVGLDFRETKLQSWQKDRMWVKKRVDHRRLGGLSRAKAWMCYSVSRGTGEATELSIELDKLSRSPVKFLEPSAKLGRWCYKKEQVDGPIWDTTTDSIEASPWPLECRLHLRAYSVLMKANVYRLLSDKEWAQLLDLRPEWGCLLRSIMWNWHGEGRTIPLRFLVELGLSVSRLQSSGEFLLSRDLGKMDCGRQLVSQLIPGNSASEKEDNIKYFGWCWEKEDTTQVQVATASDDAAVRYDLWAVGGDGKGMEEAREVIRVFLWRCWIRKTVRDGLRWLRERSVVEPEMVEVNRDAMRDCLWRLSNSTWFEWKDGSRMHFYQWPERFLAEARDGAVPWIIETPPRRLKWPVMPQEEWVKDMEAAKLAKLILRRYLESGHVWVVIPRMSVPKGLDDIRVVWDMTRNGVNPGIYAPTFFLLGIYSLNLRLHPGQFMGDFDCGEMFNNYTLHESMRKYFGVYLSEDVRRRLAPLLGVARWEDIPEYMRWGRLPFGWCPAPFFAVRMMMRSIELAKRAPWDETSEFCFVVVVLNLPTTNGYDPGLPRVYKVRRDGTIATDIGVFVDDGRVISATETLGQLGMRQVVCDIQRRGTQDAARKREAASQRARAWTGGVTYTDKGTVRKFLVKKKWDKMRAFVGSIGAADAAGLTDIDRKDFESGLGFLVHCSATYDFLRPYLVGFYLAMNRWRGNRDVNGWKLNSEGSEDQLDDVTAELHEAVERAAEDTVDRDDEGVGVNYFVDRYGRKEDDTTTEPVPLTKLLLKNASTIARLTAAETPLQLLVRPVSGKGNVVYAGSDASGEGFGIRDSLGPNGGEFIYGYWNSSTDGSSSNWREIKAGLDKLRRDAETGRLAGKEVWFITDNSTFERAFFKGYSSDEELYMMVEEMRAIALMANFLLHVVHVAGTRMIETGIDGLSRGEIELGLLRKSLMESIPLGKSPLERSPTLLSWLHSWLDENCRVASPMDWHYTAQQSDAVGVDEASTTFIWDLPPGAALYALEELASARTKRHDLLRGVVLVPCLMSPEWFRRFGKSVDVYFRIRPGAIKEWPAEMHEPLTIGIYLPCFREQPWDWKRVPWLGNLGRSLSAMHKDADTRGRDILPQFWSAACTVPHMPSRLVRFLLSHATWLPFCGYGVRRR